LKSIFETGLFTELQEKAIFLSASEGDTILRAGETIRVVPIVLSGTVKVSRTDDDGHELLLYYICSDESCAMTLASSMQQSTSEIKAVADDAVELLAIPVAVSEDWYVRYPSWRQFVMKTIKDRFNEMLKAIDQIAFQKLDERLIHYLKEKSRVNHSSLINLSHERIAAELATSRVVISRLLKKLENDKKLLLYRNQIKLIGEL